MSKITFDTVRYFLERVAPRPWRVKYDDFKPVLISSSGDEIKSDLDFELVLMLVNEIEAWLNECDKLEDMYKIKDEIKKSIETLANFSNISDKRNVAFIEPHGKEYIKIYWADGSASIQKMSTIDRWFMDFIEQLKIDKILALPIHDYFETPKQQKLPFVTTPDTNPSTTPVIEDPNQMKVTITCNQKPSSEIMPEKLPFVIPQECKSIENTISRSCEQKFFPEEEEFYWPDESKYKMLEDM